MRLALSLLLPALPLAAQSALVSVIRQPRATAAEFTTPIADFQVRDHGDLAHLHQILIADRRPLTADS